MISANRLKYYSSLLQKKYRDEEKKFIAEGSKIVEEGLKSKYTCEVVFIRKDNPDEDRSIQELVLKKGIETAFLSSREFDKISDSKTPQGISAVFHKPDERLFQFKASAAVCLDRISDPGNVGTILRSSDWFGINNILIGSGNADIFNPKTIRSSMGSVFHHNLFFYSELPVSLLKFKNQGYKIITADLKGTNLFDFQFPEKCILLFSSEAHGVSPEIKEVSDLMIAIPGYGKAESLNVAAASSIILSRYAEKN